MEPTYHTLLPARRATMRPTDVSALDPRDRPSTSFASHITPGTPMSQQPPPEAASIDHMEARLVALEASAARWRRASLLSFGLTGVALVASFQSAKPQDATWRTLRAERIEIIEPSAGAGGAAPRTVMTLGRNESNASAEIRLFHQFDPDPLAILTAAHHGARLSLKSAKSKDAEDLGSEVILYAEYPAGLAIDSRDPSDHSSLSMISVPRATSFVQATSSDGETTSKLRGDRVEVLSRSADGKTTFPVAWMCRDTDGGVVGTAGLTPESGRACLTSDDTSGRVFCASPDLGQLAELYADASASLARVKTKTAENGSTVRAALVAQPDGGAVSVCSPAGEPMAFLAGRTSGGELNVRNNPANSMKKGGALVVSPGANGPEVKLHNRTNDIVVTLSADDYGNGLVGAWDRKGQGNTLKPGD